MKINELVEKGYLPIPFYNSKISFKNSVDLSKFHKRQVNKKYMQSELPEAELLVLISKIYEVF